MKSLLERVLLYECEVADYIAKIRHRKPKEKEGYECPDEKRKSTGGESTKSDKD